MDFKIEKWKPEPLLETDDNDKYSVLPVKYANLYGMYKKQVACFWTPEEIDLSKDLADWAKLNKDEKHFLSLILAFFSNADGLVNENICLRFYNDVQNAEVRLFYTSQMFIEGIHQITYSNLIDTYIKDKTERIRLFNAIDHFDCVRLKADWIKERIHSNSSFAERLVGFACIEGIAFSGAFCCIYWFKKRGLLQGLTFSNELIARDEALHAEFAVALYNHLNNKLSQRMIHQIIKEVVELEIQFICVALPCRLIGMNADLMTEYIQYVADRLATQLGCEKIYNSSNPFDWMELISLEGKANFFEKKVDCYALATREPMDVNVFDDLNAFSF